MVKCLDRSRHPLPQKPARGPFDASVLIRSPAPGYRSDGVPELRRADGMPLDAEQRRDLARVVAHVKQHVVADRERASGFPPPKPDLAVDQSWQMYLHRLRECLLIEMSQHLFR